MAERDRIRRRILYIEDEPDISRLVAKVLTLEGYEVIAARRGSQGMDLLYEIFPHLVLLDMKMSVMSGYKVLESLKARSGLREIPVICVTGLAGLKNVHEAFSMGADGYILKPIEFSFMLALIEFLVEEGDFARRAASLLSMPLMRKVGLLAGKEIDSLEKLDLITCFLHYGGGELSRPDLARRARLEHEDLGRELFELAGAGFLEPGRDEEHLRISAKEKWRLRAEGLRAAMEDSEKFQALINGIHTGVISYAIDKGLWGDREDR